MHGIRVSLRRSVGLAPELAGNVEAGAQAMPTLRLAGAP